jgi:hypothetical protein
MSCSFVSFITVLTSNLIFPGFKDLVFPRLIA